MLTASLAQAAAVEIEFRLVAHDRPDVTVDKLEHERPITNPVSTGRGVEMEKIGLDVACWARNVRLNGQPLFERYHEGKYIDRLPIARAKLNLGDHTIWPGNHVFTVTKEGKVTTADPEMILEEDGRKAPTPAEKQAKGAPQEPPVLRIKCYPVRFRAYRANPDEADLPMSMRVTPLPHLTIRESADHEQDAARPKGASSRALELLPLFDKFAPLTIWLPANQVGKGYVAHPIGLTFHLGAEGILPGAGGGETVEGIALPRAIHNNPREAKATGSVVDIPLYGYPVDGVVGAKAVVPGVEQFAWSVHQAGETLLTNWYPRRAPYELQVTKDGPSITLSGALRPLPLKSFRVDIADPATGTQRALAVEIATRHLTPGGTLQARIRAVQATPPPKDAKAPESPKPEETPAAPPPNPLENSPRFGQLQLYGSSAWADLKLETAANGEVKVPIPDVPDGVYRLRLGVRPADPAGRPLSVDRWVSVARPRPIGVGLFTPRGRDAFYRGESFGIALGAIAIGAPVAAGAPVEADLVDSRGQRQPLLRSTLPRGLNPAGGNAVLPRAITETPAGGYGRDTIVIRLGRALTLALAPGRYHIEARVGGQASRPLSFDLTEPTPRTRFTNMLIGKYCVFGDYYQRLLRTGEGAEEFVREIVAAGYNAFMGMTYDVNRVSRRGLDIEQLVRERPELGPWESYYQPSGRDRFLNAAVRHNLRFYENLFTYNDTMLPREPRILDACERFVGLEVASMRHSPAFQGVCLYDEFYSSSESGTVRPVIDAFYKGEEMSYREKHKGMTSSEALKALDRYAGRPVGQRRYEDLAKFRTWPAHQDAEWGDFSSRMAHAVKAVMPASQNFTLQRFWGGNGGNLAANGTPEDVFAPLDAAACVMYKDGGYGDRPVFAPMQADVLRTRDDLPVWTQLHTFHAPGLFGPHLIRQAFFALSQRIDGLTFFTVPHDYRNPSAGDYRDTVRDIAARLTTPCGDFFLACQRGYRRVGIYYSREADYLTLRKPEKLVYACEGLWVACMRAGFPADFLYDRQIREGRGMDYDVLFVPGFVYEDETPPDILAALKRLLNAGKTIVVERSSRLPLEGIVRLDSNLDEYDDKLGGAFPRNVDFETEMVWDQSEEMTKTVRQFLAKRIPPAAQRVDVKAWESGSVGAKESGSSAANALTFSHSHALTVLDWLKCGQGEYLVIPNFAPAPFTGLYKTLYQAPDCPTLRFPKRPPICYDLLEMKRTDVATEGDWMTLQADLRSYPGKIYAFLPAPIDKVGLQVGTGQANPAELHYQVAVLDNAGKRIEAGFPIQITVSDPSGRVMLDICRAAAPEFRGVYSVPRTQGGPATWKLRARELISGAFAEASIEVAAPKAPATELESGRAAWVRDGGRVREFLAGKGPFLIAVDDDQPWVKEHADGLAGSLAKRGMEAKVVRAADAIRLPLDWNTRQPVLDGTRLWRGDVVQPGLFIDSPLILLGKRYENRLIEALVRRDLLAEPFSENLPGPGKAMVTWTRRAFSNQHDTVAILADGQDGLQAGIAQLLAIAAGKGVGEWESGRVGAKESGSSAPNALTLSPSHALTAFAALTLSRSHALTQNGKAPSSYRDAVSSEDHIRCVDVEPASGRAVVGTHGYGHNLFCFSGEGKLLWKQFLPEHNVYFARWYDGGKRVAAATGRGFFLFLLDGADGRVLKKFAATEWPLLHGGFTAYQEGAVNTEVPIALNPPLRQILIGGITGLMAVDYDGKKMWYRDRAEAIASYPPEAIQTAGAEFGGTVVVGGFALSPDGAKLVHSEYEIAGSTQRAPGEFVLVWRHKPMVLDARTGQVLAENRDDPGNQTSPSGWAVSWLPLSSFPLPPGEGQGEGRSKDGNASWGDAIPVVHTTGLAAPLLPDGKLGPFRSFEGRVLKVGGRLIATPTRLERLAADGRSLWQAADETLWLPELDQLSLDESRLYRCDRDGLVRCLDLSSPHGKTLWEQKLPFNAVLCPVGDGLAAGAKNGAVVRLDASGKILWQTRLRDHHELPSRDYPAYLHSALRRDPDSTRDFFPVGEDKPGEYDSVLRMGMEQLANGGFEAEGGWNDESRMTNDGMASAGKPVAAGSPAHSGAKALLLKPGQLVSQRLKARVIPSATYLLEFFYRVEDERTRVVAGALLSTLPRVPNPREGNAGILTASRFSARPGDWAFGRLAVKSMADTKTLDVGFEAEGGTVRVDDVSFRPIRFPSANLLANEELHAIEPTFVRDYRVLYDRIPRGLAEKLIRQNHVVAFRQGVSSTAAAQLQEQAFLHNGRLDDVGSRWFYQPDFPGFSVVLAKSAYVSHLVLYLNNSTPDNVYRTMSVVANNLETKLPQAVALVRSNRRRFIVVHFPELLHTDAIKILPGLHRTHQDCLTEVEVYGPLGGPAMAKQGRKFTADPDATPMFMGNPSHVPTKLPADLVGGYREIGRHRIGRPVYGAGGTAADGVFTFNEAEGPVRSIQLRTPDPKEQQPRYVEAGPAWPVGTVTPTATPARYAARLVVGSADAKVHAVADNGMHLWAFATGGRVYSSPAPDGDEAYFGSDDGKLYKVDIDSGIPIWEFAAGDKIRSSPALTGGKVFAASWDGFLYAVDVATGREAWKAPIAKFTRSSPAVSSLGGAPTPRVYIGDEQGYAHCFDAATGKPLWKQAVANGGKADYVSCCPVVTDDGVFLSTEGGAAALFDHNGNPRWKRDLGARLTGQPVATQTQILMPSEKGILVLRRSDGQPDGRFAAPPPYFEGWRKTPPPMSAKVVSVVPYGDKVFLVEACARVDWGTGQRPYAQYEGFAVVWAPAPKTPPAAPKK